MVARGTKGTGFWLASALAVTACSSGIGAGADTMTVERATAEYRTWQQRTAQPVAISEQIFSLCRLPTLPEQTFADSEHGKGRALLDWINPGAAAGFSAGGATAFPVGATIVKEKLVSASTGFTLAALGVMIKRPAGFDVTHGDWEFAYWEPAPGLMKGAPQAEYCGACHAGARATDFVFFDESWRTP